MKDKLLGIIGAVGIIFIGVCFAEGVNVFINNMNVSIAIAIIGIPLLFIACILAPHHRQLEEKDSKIHMLEREIEELKKSNNM